MSAGAPVVQKKASGPLDLESQAVMNHVAGALGSALSLPLEMSILHRFSFLSQTEGL